MHSVLVITHVGLMIISLGAMASALILGFLGKRIAAFIATASMTATAIGSACGAILLLSGPFTLQCVTLTAYLVGMSALYNYGFAMGDGERARLIRSSVQD